MHVPVELKKRYLDRRILELKELMDSLEREDYNPALKLGHQIKGNAVTFDFPQIAPYGRQIESAAKNQDKDSLRALATELVGLIQEAQTQFH